MKNVNWDTVQEEVRRPTPGGYIAKITKVEDNEQKEYLRIEWDFVEGEFKGANQETFEVFGFWPTAFVQSYKNKALRYFKGFKTAVEMSNRNYTFCNNPESLVGKYIGVVLGEEEYVSGNGEIKKRLYVAQKRSGKAIRDGDYDIPELKKHTGSAPASNPPAAASANYGLLEDDEQFPF